MIMNSKFEIRNCHCEPKARQSRTRFVIPAKAGISLAIFAVSLFLFAACTDYQAEFDGAFSGLEYADDPGELIPGSSDDWIPESSDNQVPGSSGVQNPESSSDQIPESSEVQNPESSGDNGPGISSGKTSSSATGSSSSQPGQSSSSVSSSSMSSSSQSSSSSVSSSSMSSSSQSSSSSAKVYCFGTSYNPETQFCDYRQMAIYDYCNGNEWNPSTQYCHNNKEIRSLSECVLKNGEKLFFNPDSQYCDESEGRKKLSLCADTLIRQDEYCYTTSKAPNTIQVGKMPKCGDRLYDPLKEFCYLESSSHVKKRTICHANPTKMDSLNIDLRVSSLDAKGHNGQICDTRDYKIYGAAQIGHQIWMTQNLNYRYTNSATDSSSFCYGGDTSNCNKYGRLYTWSAAIDSTKLAKDGTICGFGKSCTLSSPVKGVCPDGWHLPTEDEFNELIAHVVTYARGNEKTAAQELKSQSGWNSANGVDAWQFSLLPAGVREEDGVSKYEGSRAYLWTSTQYTGSDAPYCIGDFCAHYVDVDSGNPPTATPGIKTAAMSVRCVQKVVEPE